MNDENGESLQTKYSNEWITPGEKCFLQSHLRGENMKVSSHILAFVKGPLSTPLIKQAITQLFRVHMQCAFILFSWVHFLSCLFHPLKNSSFLPPTANCNANPLSLAMHMKKIPGYLLFILKRGEQNQLTDRIPWFLSLLIKSLHFDP